MQPYRSDFRKLIPAFVGVSIVSLLTILLLTDKLEGENVISSVFRLGTILTIVTVLWVYFNNIGWRQKLFRISGWMSDLPDIRGRWVGTLDRDGEGRPHRFVLEVYQNFSKIQIYTFSSRSSSSSIAVDFATDSNRGSFYLVYTWLSDAGPLEGEVSSTIFYGTCVFRIVENRGRRMLDGHYYTARAPRQTRGKIMLEWEGLSCSNSFDDQPTIKSFGGNG